MAVQQCSPLAPREGVCAQSEPTAGADSSRSELATLSGAKLLECILVECRRQWEARTLAKYEKAGRTPPKNWKSGYPEPVGPKTDELPELPKDWCWATVDQCADVQGGLQKSPSRAPAKNHYPYLRVANVLRGRLVLTELHRFELSTDSSSKFC